MNEVPPPKPKRQYNYSIATKARMAAQKKLRQAKKTAENKGIKIYEKSAALSYSGKKEIIVKKQLT